MRYVENEEILLKHMVRLVRDVDPDILAGICTLDIRQGRYSQIARLRFFGHMKWHKNIILSTVLVLETFYVKNCYILVEH